MHRTVSAALILIALLSATVFGQQAAPQSKKDQAIDKEIRRLNTEEHDAFMRNDAKSLANIWSDDFVVTNPFNQFVTKQQVLNLVENGTLAFKSYERNIEYLKTYGDTVIVAGSETCVWGGKIPIAGQTSHLRFTQVWRMQGGHWREVARHANIVPPQQAKPAL
jgi:ketosteroid isomerase-like protein